MADNINEIVSEKAISGLIEANKQLNTAGGSVDTLNKNIETLLKTLESQTKTQEDVNKRQKEAVETQKDIDKIGIQLQKTQQKLIDLDDERQKEIEKTNKAIRERKKEIKEEIALEGRELGTREKIKKQLKELRLEREQLNLETKEGIDRLSELNIEIDENNKKLEDSSDKLAKQKIGIGGYADGIKEAVGDLGLFDGALGAAGDGAVSLGAKLKKLAKNPFILAIILIIGAIAGLIAMFKKTQAGQDVFAKKFEQISSIIDVVVGRLTRLAKAAVKLLSRDFKGAAEAARGSFKGIKEEIEETAKAAGQIYDLRVALEELNITSTTSIAKLKALSEQQTAIADDATRSFKEREIASEAARKSSEMAATQEVELAKQSLNLIKEENNLKEQQGILTRELRQKEADAAAAVIESEGMLTQTLFENEKQRRELKQDRLEKDLDILIDGFDNQKTINERLIADDKKTIEERAKILDDTFKLADDSFNKQGETIQKFTDKAIDFNDLLATSDATVLNEKIRGLGLSEIIEGRLLEVIRERRIVTQDLIEAQSDLNEESAVKAKESADKQAEINKAVVDAALSERERQFERELMLIDATATSEEEKAQRIAAAEIGLVQSQIDQTNKLISTLEEGSAERIGLEQEVLDKQLEIDQIRIESDNAVAENQKVNDEERKERLLTLAQDINGIAQQGFEFASVLRDREQAEVDKQLEAGLISEEEAAVKSAEIQRKQAVADKIAALFGIAVNTALAATKVTAQTGVGAALAVPLVIASGALQAATVLAQPLPTIPEFIEGTKGRFNTPSTFTTSEDGRTELMTLRTGEVIKTDKKTLFSGNKFKGARITSNPEYEYIKSQTSHNGFGGTSFTDAAIVGEIKGLRSDLKKQKTRLPDNSGWTRGSFTMKHLRKGANL